MYHVLCVAPQESQADALSDALARLTDVLVVGICDPHQAVQMARVVGADLVVTPEGTVIPGDEQLTLPVVATPANTDPAEVLAAFLKKQVAAESVTPRPIATAPSTRLPFAPVTRPLRVCQMRIGLYGTRGGVGTTTAAVTVAKLMAAQGRSVALYDAAQRGDPYLLLGLTPSDQPATTGRITVYPDMTLDDARVAHDVIVIDGGRERRVFPARWIAVDKPLSETELARMLGLPLPTPT